MLLASWVISEADKLVEQQVVEKFVEGLRKEHKEKLAELAIFDNYDAHAYAGFDAPLDATRPQTFSFAAAGRDRAATLGLLIGDTLDYNETGVAGNVIAGRFSDGQAFTIVNQLQSRRGADFDAENLPVEAPCRSMPSAPMASAMLRNRFGRGWLLALMNRPGLNAPPPAPASTSGRLTWVWRLPSALPEPYRIIE